MAHRGNHHSSLSGETVYMNYDYYAQVARRVGRATNVRALLIPTIRPNFFAWHKR